MKGLMYKDCMVLIRQFRYALLIMVLFSLMPNSAMAAFAMTYSLMIPVTAISYDERSGWNRLACMMPVPRATIVLEKYLLSLLCVGGAFAISMLGHAAMRLFAGTIAQGQGTLIGLGVSAAIALMANAVMLPIVFKLGSEKGRIAMLVVFFAAAGGVMLLMGALPQAQLAALTDNPALSLLLLPVAFILLYLSYRVSVGIYTNKEF